MFLFILHTHALTHTDTLAEIETRRVVRPLRFHVTFATALPMYIIIRLQPDSWAAAAVVAAAAAAAAVI